MARILIAEDEEPVRIFVSRALEHFGHSVRAVADGGAALQALHDESFDLLLTDIVMPVMDGIALALKASSEWPGMPVVLMTGYAAEKQRAHNLEELVHDVVSKPFSLDEIGQIIQAALDARDAD
ncbi:response regulator [Govanella unica]|uniref:Response regulator n=1 Tax=Govanella unica TaxID=2975056 RepID=A0A9X3TVQ4_9PROT|nr:response regulator [Govania unica]MDA5192599.1 response regulator [Govania unica]